MAQSPNHPEDQEIDLKALSRGISRSIEKTNFAFYRLFRFIWRNIVIIGLVFIAGAVLGYLSDRDKSYESKLVVSPNFGSTDYVYGKIQLLDSKLKRRDTAFLKAIGIKYPKKLGKVTIGPINDVYQFVTNNTQNFELFKLMVEDGNVSKIIEDPTTSKNYPHHVITITTNGLASEKDMIDPILEYLNNSEFFAKIQREYVNNVNIKLQANQQTIEQINGLLDRFSQKTNAPASSTPNLVYYNDNTQLNDVLKTKDELIREQGLMRIDLVSLDKIVKRNSQVLNTVDDSGMNGKMMLVLPIIFVILFLVISVIWKAFKKQKAKYADA